MNVTESKIGLKSSLLDLLASAIDRSRSVEIRDEPAHPDDAQDKKRVLRIEVEYYT